MGLFWIKPDKFLNLDSVNRKYLAAKHGITVTGLPDYQTYVEYMRRTRSELQKPFYEISHDAWLAEQSPVAVNQELRPEDRGQRYWLFAPGEHARFWEQYSKEGLMGVGWVKLNEDLSAYKTDDALRKRMSAVYGDELTDSSFRQLRDFLHGIRKGDFVFAKRGTKELVGFGEVTSDYFYDPAQNEYRHLRKVQWQKQGIQFL